ncbi:MAG: dinitrogenase iron-molybdenum cofactor biosynthesis protein [Magnetococcus sp. WYHC-3]
MKNDDLELALRIGLAGRELPGVANGILVQALTCCLGTPFTAEKFAALRPGDLQLALAQGGAAEVAPSQVGSAVARLQRPSGVSHGEDPVKASPPRAAGAVRVACASNLGENLDGHFGSCARFLVYDVTATAVTPVQARSCFALNRGDENDRNAARVAMIRDCQLLCLQSIGGPAAARVTRAGLMPLKFPDGGPIPDILESLRQKLAQSPPPWLAKCMAVGA